MQKKVLILISIIAIIAFIAPLYFYRDLILQSASNSSENIENSSPIDEQPPIRLLLGQTRYSISALDNIIVARYKIENSRTYERNTNQDWIDVGDESFIYSLNAQTALVRPGWNKFYVYETSTGNLLLKLEMEFGGASGNPSWFDIEDGGCLRTGDTVKIVGYTSLSDGININYAFHGPSQSWTSGIVGAVLSNGDFSIDWKIPKTGDYRIYYDMDKICIIDGEHKREPRGWDLAIVFDAGSVRSWVLAKVEPSMVIQDDPRLWVKTEMQSLTITVSEKYDKEGTFYIFLESESNQWTKVFDGYAETGTVAVIWTPPEKGEYLFLVIFNAWDSYVTTSTFNIGVEVGG